MSDDALDRTLAALADPSRRRVVDLLRESPRRAGDLAETLGMSPAAMSRHLRVLRKAGVIGEQGQDEDGRARTYRLREEPFAALRSWVPTLAEVEAFWTMELAAFKTHAERAYAAEQGARKASMAKGARTKANDAKARASASRKRTSS